MKTEYEATFSNINKQDIREKLKSLNAKLIKPEFLMKRLTFNLHTNEKGKWVRIRDEGDKITMTLKQILGEGKTIDGQKELEFVISDFKTAEDFLSEIGCIKKAYQENKREIWNLNDVEVVIDEWPFLEPFVEVEGVDEASVRKISELLGFDWGKAIFSSTDVQYSSKYSVSKDFVVNKIDRIAFGDKNPFIKKDN